MRKLSRIKLLATLGIGWTMAAGASVLSVRAHATTPPTAQVAQDINAKPGLDRSGRPRIGIASFYKTSYNGKKMADGTPFKINGNNAASITLPLGTTARVTNLETGRSAVVVIRDRGPYVGGRLVDLSPGTARAIGINRKQGLAKVQVAPLTVPAARSRLTAANVATPRFTTE